MRVKQEPTSDNEGSLDPEELEDEGSQSGAGDSADPAASALDHPVFSSAKVNRARPTHMPLVYSVRSHLCDRGPPGGDTSRFQKGSAPRRQFPRELTPDGGSHVPLVQREEGQTPNHSQTIHEQSCLIMHVCGHAGCSQFQTPMHRQLPVVVLKAEGNEQV